jgi:UDP-2,3-diacylglucosamine hydrolase
LGQGNKYEQFLGEEKEWLVGFCKKFLREEGHIDYFVFGHRHLVLEMSVSENSRYLNAGTWVNDSAYAVFDGETTTIKRFESL